MVFIFRLDVSNYEGCEKVVNAAVEKFGKKLMF